MHSISLKVSSHRSRRGRMVDRSAVRVLTVSLRDSISERRFLISSP